MDNEQTAKSDDTGTKTDPVPEKDKPVSIVDEARSIRDEIKQEREKLEAANTEKSKLQADEMLSSSAGGHVEPQKKEETNQEYVDRMRKNGWKADG